MLKIKFIQGEIAKEILNDFLEIQRKFACVIKIEKLTKSTSLHRIVKII